MNTDDLRNLLQRLHVEQDDHLRHAFARSLPFQDGLFDRWERATRLGFAPGSSIYNSALVFGDVMVGERTWVGPYVILDGSGGSLRIGAYCSISSGVHIYTHDTVKWSLSRGAAAKRSASVAIGDCVYIGSQSVIAAGVSIGSRAVVAANSFVNSNVDANTVVGGSPAKRLGRVVGEGEDVSIVYD